MNWLSSNSSHLLVVLFALGALPCQLNGESIWTFGFELQLGPRSVIKAEQCKDGDKKRLCKPHLPRQPPTATSIISERQVHNRKDNSLSTIFDSHLVTENSGWDIWWCSFRRPGVPDRHRFLPISSFFPSVGPICGSLAAIC